MRRRKNRGRSRESQSASAAVHGRGDNARHPRRDAAPGRLDAEDAGQILKVAAPGDAESVVRIVDAADRSRRARGQDQHLDHVVDVGEHRVALPPVDQHVATFAQDLGDQVDVQPGTGPPDVAGPDHGYRHAPEPLVVESQLFGGTFGATVRPDAELTRRSSFVTDRGMQLRTVDDDARDHHEAPATGGLCGVEQVACAADVDGHELGVVAPVTDDRRQVIHAVGPADELHHAPGVGDIAAHYLGLFESLGGLEGHGQSANLLAVGDETGDQTPAEEPCRAGHESSHVASLPPNRGQVRSSWPRARRTFSLVSIS